MDASLVCHEAMQSDISANSKNINAGRCEVSHYSPRSIHQAGHTQGINNLCVELELPHPDHYRPETVDFPSSPSGMLKYRIEDDRDHDVSQSERAEGKVPESDSEDENSFKAVLDLNNSVHLRKEDSSDSASENGNDDYFEDFPLPMSNSTSMSTRRSFKRKIKSLDVQACIADPPIKEAASNVGEPQRNNSARRKIVPQPRDFTSDSLSSDQFETSPVKLTSTPNKTFTDFDMAGESTIFSAPPHHELLHQLQKEDYHDQNDLAPMGGTLADDMQLDEGTILKVRECLDSEKAKDLYTLGSRLQDILSPAELMEVLSKRQVINPLTKTDSHGAVQSVANQLNPSVTASCNPSDVGHFDSLVDRGADRKMQPTTGKKRISILEDMTRSRTDDSDIGEDFDAGHCASSTLDDISLATGNQERQQSEPTRSVSLGTPSDGWDISPESLPMPMPNSNENSIVDRVAKPDLIPETSQAEKEEERLWRSVMISGLERKIDLKVIEPYKKVLSHGGYLSNDCQTAIIVFSACFLPDRGRADYDYVMENLFLYVLTTLDHLVAEDYVLIYFHGATPKTCIPRFSWVKNCYQMIDRRLRKNLKRLYLVHPTLWLKAAVLMCRPFISAKFTRKIVYIPSLPSLAAELPMDQVCIPDRVKQLDFTLMIQELKRKKGVR